MVWKFKPMKTRSSLKRFAAVVFCLLACGGSLPAEESKETPDPSDDVTVLDAKANDMLGTYVGGFGDRIITISLDRVVGQTVTGYSIVAGNERAFSGAWKATEQGFHIVAKEPGDHPHDGIFNIDFSPQSKSISGSWEANDKKIAGQTFNLARRVFKYNPKAGEYPQSSTKLLAEKDVENMERDELRIMRNEIYARHGYSFKLPDMREHFNRLDWYMPIATNIKTQLTETEKKNAALIKRYEKYTEEYYDSFGR